MAEHSAIEWTDSTFNPWEGCQKVGPGCDHCYAESRNARFGGGVAVNWGPGAPRRRTSVASWRKPVQWNAAPFFACPDCGRRGDAQAMGDEPKGCSHANAQPARRRVFCASLADVFDNQVEALWRRDLFQLIADTPHLDWLLLTKRIGNARPMIAEATATVEYRNQCIKPWTSADPWPNVWLGATVVTQAEADRDIPKLLAVPARVRFLSIEPMLGAIDLDAAFWRYEGPKHIARGLLHWVICGGESGPHARPTHPDWARRLRGQCVEAGVPFLFKQWGEWLPGSQAREVDSQMALVGACMRGWKWDDGTHSWCIGKAAAGRLLDGVEHNGSPA